MRSNYRREERQKIVEEYIQSGSKRKFNLRIRYKKKCDTM